MSSSSGLTADQVGILRTFQEISSIEDETLCLQILQVNHWNLEQALSQYVDGSSQDLREVPLAAAAAAAASSSSSSAGGAYSRQSSRASSARPPVSSSNASNTASGSVRNTSTTTTTGQNNQENGLLDMLFLPLRWLFQSRPIALNPQRDTQRFIEDFNTNYGQHHARFHDNSYQTAVSAAFQQSKFLLVYLHSPLHEDTDRFCQQVFCQTAFTNVANQHMVVWGGNVWDAEAYGLSSQLGVTSFPFMALLVCQSTRSAQIADRIQGFQEVSQVLDRLQNAMSVYSTILNRNRMETERRTEAQRLREQQDREYQESLEAERREIERKAAEEQARIQAEEEKKQQEELAAAIELSKKLTREDTIRKLKASFNAIPEPDTGSDVATIRFQLPRGAKLSRKFLKSDTMQRIHDYLSIHFADEGDVTKNFSMCTHFPKVEVTDLTQTVGDLVSSYQ